MATQVRQKLEIAFLVCINCVILCLFSLPVIVYYTSQVSYMAILSTAGGPACGLIDTVFYGPFVMCMYVIVHTYVVALQWCKGENDTQW